MFGSTTIDVAIGLIFIYFIVGAICSHLNELVAGIFGWRSAHLEEGIRTLLGDPRLADNVLDHPLIRGLGGKDGRMPSYIPASTFSGALFDALVPPSGKPPALEAVRKQVETLPDESARRALVSLIDSAEGNVARARSGVESWFDAKMDRVSGVYKRRVQWTMLAMAAVVTFTLNVDSIAIANTLWQQPAVRAALSGAVQASGALNPDSVVDTLSQFDLPLGWSEPPMTTFTWGLKIAGLVLTTLAASLGAPFWFEILKRIGGNPRSAGPVSGGRK